MLKTKKVHANDEKTAKSFSATDNDGLQHRFPACSLMWEISQMHSKMA